jgi:hypothetical protein
MWAEKDERTAALLKQRSEAAISRRTLYSLLARERQSVTNAMAASKVTKKLHLPVHIRRNISDETLKAVLDLADPKQTGVISLVRAVCASFARAPRGEMLSESPHIATVQLGE